MKRILFVCVENSNRSQMAEAFARMHGKGRVEAYSAGSAPSGRINPKAIEAMKEIGYDLTVHASRSVEEIPQVEYDLLVGLGCGDNCPYVPSKQRIEWDIPDPREMDKEAFRKVRDLIERQVVQLLDQP